MEFDRQDWEHRILDGYNKLPIHDKWRLNHFSVEGAGFITRLNDEDDTMLTDILNISEKYKENVADRQIRDLRDTVINIAIRKYKDLGENPTYKDSDRDLERERLQNEVNRIYFYAVVKLLLLQPVWAEIAECYRTYDKMTGGNWNTERSHFSRLEDMIKFSPIGREHEISR